MSPVYIFQFFILFLGVNSFTLLIYMIYYGQLFSSICCDTFEKQYDYIIGKFLLVVFIILLSKCSDYSLNYSKY